MVDFPSSLPQYLDTDGFEDEIPDDRLRSQTDIGPPMMRRRSSAKPTPVKGAQLLTETQFQTLKDFYNDDLDGGVLRFNWIGQTTGNAVEYRFVTPPKRSAIYNDLFVVEYDLEIMP